MRLFFPIAVFVLLLLLAGQAEAFITFPRAAVPVDNAQFKGYYVHYYCDGKQVRVFSLLPNMPINCENKEALRLLSAAQYFQGKSYTNELGTGKEKQSDSGLIVVALKQLNRQGLRPKGVTDIERAIRFSERIWVEAPKSAEMETRISRSAQGKKVVEPDPCLWEYKTFAMEIAPKVRVPNRPDTLYGCFSTLNHYTPIKNVYQLKTGDLAFFDTTFTQYASECYPNLAANYYDWTKVNKGCFRGTNRKPVTHAAIVISFQRVKGILQTFEQSPYARAKTGEDLMTGANPRLWCDPKKKDFRDESENEACDRDPSSDLSKFAGGVRLSFEETQRVFDVWEQKEFDVGKISIKEKDIVKGVKQCVTALKKACPVQGVTIFKGKKWNLANYYCILLHASSEYRIPISLLRAQTIQESVGDQFAISYAGASGYMQLMPGTAAGMGIGEGEIFDPHYNICGGVEYIARQMRDFRSVECGLAAYNAGPYEETGTVQRRNPEECRNHPYAQTRGYVQLITGYWTDIMNGKIPNLKRASR